VIESTTQHTMAAAAEERAASDSEEEVILDLTNSDVVSKYRLSSDIVNKALEGVLSQVVAGKNVVDICAFGDSLITAQCATQFKNKSITKGVAFPTCVSVNECVCHYSPLTTESVELKAGDMVKIDIGAHIDGFVAVAAHTVIVPGEDGTIGEISGPQADVLVAAHAAAGIAARLIKDGNTVRVIHCCLAS
jgi:methionine aminopeptidase